MLSWKRMLYVVLIVAAVSFIFMLYNINEERTRHIQEEKREFTGTQQLSGGEKPQVRLVGEGSGEVCQDIRRNMEQLFANLHYTVIREEELRPEELEPGELVVFCDGFHRTRRTCDSGSRAPGGKRRFLSVADPGNPGKIRPGEL